MLPLLRGSGEQGPQQLDLKPLLVELKYAFLGGKMHCPVVISSLLSNPQEVRLLQIFHMNKTAIGWKIFRFERHQPDRMHPSYILRRGIESGSAAIEETESAYATGGTSGSVEIATSRHHIPHIRQLLGKYNPSSTQEIRGHYGAQ